MEINFEIIVFFTLIVYGAIEICILYKIEKIEYNLNSYLTDQEELLRTLLENFQEVDDKIVSLSDQFEKSTLAFKDILEPQIPMKTMKSNNWDSVRDAFRGPTRTEIDV